MIRRADIVAAAMTWRGTPYHHQASLKAVGCDCLGLVRGVWRDLYGQEPEAPPAYSRDWAEALAMETLAEAAGRHLVPIALDAVQTGDVVLFAHSPAVPAKHCAILTAPDRMIHAIETHPVEVVSLVPWWRRRMRFAFAFPHIDAAD